MNLGSLSATSYGCLLVSAEVVHGVQLPNYALCTVEAELSHAAFHILLCLVHKLKRLYAV